MTEDGGNIELVYSLGLNNRRDEHKAPVRGSARPKTRCRNGLPEFDV